METIYATVQQNEDAGTTELGAVIEGVFVPFYTLPTSTVDRLIHVGNGTPPPPPVEQPTS